MMPHFPVISDMSPAFWLLVTTIIVGLGVMVAMTIAHCETKTLLEFLQPVIAGEVGLLAGGIVRDRD